MFIGKVEEVFEVIKWDIECADWSRWKEIKAITGSVNFERVNEGILLIIINEKVNRIIKENLDSV